MIHNQNKPFQMVLWLTGRNDPKPAFRMEFDTLKEAEAEFACRQQARAFQAGILMQWHKHSQTWDLIDRFPQ